jgi:hypothetical protein
MHEEAVDAQQQPSLERPDISEKAKFERSTIAVAQADPANPSQVTCANCIYFGPPNNSLDILVQL